MQTASHRLGIAALLGALAVQPIAAHSWVEELYRVDSNGTMIGSPGYMRAYAPRNESGFSDDFDTYLLPPNGRAQGDVVLPTDALCHPGQTKGNQSDGYPKLSASPGDFVALRYQENGHVTLFMNNPTKPNNRGTVYIYGTSEPADNELFNDVFRQWTSDGTGGNGRGRLLATRNFDDGQCYQVNQNETSVQRQAKFHKTAEEPEGGDLWCQNDIQLPSNLTAGADYTIYWIWSWPTMNKPGSPTDIPGAGYNITTLQYYTSCMDISISNAAGGKAKKVKNFATSFATGQDLNRAAVLDQLTGGDIQVKGTDITTPGGVASGSNSSGTESGSNSGSGSGSGTAAAGSSASAGIANGAANTNTAVAATGTATAGAGAGAGAGAAGSGAGNGGAQTITVTETQASVTVTQTVGADAATGNAGSAEGPVSTTTVTMTIQPDATGATGATGAAGDTATGAAGASATGSTGAAGATTTPTTLSTNTRSSTGAAGAGTTSAAAGGASGTPPVASGQAPTVSPFLGATGAAVRRRTQRIRRRI